MMPVHPQKGAQMRMDCEKTPVGPQKGPILRMEWKKGTVQNFV